MKLALGTVQFGLAYGVANRTGCVSLEEARAIVEYARTIGMDTVDTAIDYGDSERRLGEIGMADWRVVTKLPAVPDSCTDVAAWVVATIRGSVQRLRTSIVYAVLLHRPQQLLEKNGPRLYEGLRRLQHDGLVRKIGVSVYSPEELTALSVNYDFDIVQAPLNILDRRFAESGWLSRLQELGTELHTRSAFLQGRLLMSASERPAKFNRWSSIWRTWDSWLAAAGVTPMAACLRYVLAFTEVDRVVVGFDTLRQLTEIADSLEGELPPLPGELRVGDHDLLNPARWDALPS